MKMTAAALRNVPLSEAALGPHPEAIDISEDRAMSELGPSNCIERRRVYQIDNH
jgi:hypothetical protein